MALILLMAGWAGAAAQADGSGRMVANRLSGLAIDGFDPVAYFTDGRPLRGEPDLELSQGGTVWRFRNEGNRAFFAANPEVYSPQFSGYDAVDVARGVGYPGNPQYWLISGSRLYLFGRQQTRDAFVAAPEAVLREARKRWSQVESELPQ